MPTYPTTEKWGQRKARNVILPSWEGEVVEELFLLVKGRAFSCLLTQKCSSEPLELTKFCLKITLAVRNLARLTWCFTIWGPTPTLESTSNTIKRFNSCGTLPKMPCFIQTSISAWTSPMEASEHWSFLPALGPHQPLFYQLAE